MQYSVQLALRMWLETISDHALGLEAGENSVETARIGIEAPLAGSSSSSTPGWWTMAWPIATRWR